jgi:hypothetical protein
MRQGALQGQKNVFAGQVRLLFLLTLSKTGCMDVCGFMALVVQVQSWLGLM